ncbi:DUF2218 domain-containing protein [Streptomyces sp. NPDC010273]|uniref:DUF2218 domain-containing protein n=1 Tax=Streptomyces sp. NPDC010273 TaxID=3364829 RepID=UPI0036E09C6E
MVAQPRHPGVVHVPFRSPRHHRPTAALRQATRLPSGASGETSWDEETGRGRLVFQDGTGTLTATDGALLLAVEAEPEFLDRLEDVVGRHLVRFGTKDELVVEWRRDTGEPGTSRRGTGGSA